jgi:hypothetical protein
VVALSNSQQTAMAPARYSNLSWPESLFGSFSHDLTIAEELRHWKQVSVWWPLDGSFWSRHQMVRIFEALGENVLVPELRTGDVVVLDNLSSHKSGKTQGFVKGTGATLLFLPPYSPGFIAKWRVKMLPRPDIVQSLTEC